MEKYIPLCTNRVSTTYFNMHITLTMSNAVMVCLNGYVCAQNDYDQRMSPLIKRKWFDLMMMIDISKWTIFKFRNNYRWLWISSAESYLPFDERKKKMIKNR